MKNITLSLTFLVSLGLSTLAQADEPWLQHYKPYQQDQWSTELLSHPVPVSLDTAAYTAAMERRASQRGDALEGHGNLLAMQLRTRHPDLSGAEGAQFIRDVRGAMERRLDPAMPFDKKVERVKTIADGYVAGAKLMTGQLSVDNAMNVYKAAKEYNTVLDEEKQRAMDDITLAAFQQETGMRLQDVMNPSDNVYHLPGVAAQINERAKKDSTLGTMVEAANEKLAVGADGRSKIHVNDSYEETARHMPELEDSFAIKHVVQLAKEGKITAQEMKATLKQISAQQKKIVEHAVANARQLKILVDKATTAEEKAKEEEKLRQEAARFADSMGLMRAELGLATTLFRGIDPQAARIAQMTGSHALDIYEAIHKFSAGNLTTAAFSANLMNIASSLIGALFGGPSDLQIILQELAEVRKDIHALHQDMMRGFADVHTHLDQMSKHFDASIAGLQHDMSNGLANLKGSLDEVQMKVDTLKDQINAVDISTRDYLRDGFFLRTKEAVEDSSSMKAIRSLSNERAREYMSRFFTCAATLSSRPLFAGGNFRVATGSGLVATKELPEVPLFSALEPRLSDRYANAYEIQTLMEMFEGQFQVSIIPRDSQGVPKPLANYLLWQTCTDAFLRVGAYHPELLTMDLSRLRRLYEVGQTLKQTEQALALGKDREKVSTGLIRSYERIAEQLSLAIEKNRGQFINDVNKIKEVPNPGHYNPWAGVEQPLVFEQPVAALVGNVGVCPEADQGTKDGWGRDYTFPANEATYQNTIPKNFLMAAQMKLGKLQICYTVVYPANYQRTELRPGASQHIVTPFGENDLWTNYWFGHLRLVLHVYYTPASGPQQGVRQRIVDTTADSIKEYPCEEIGKSTAPQRYQQRHREPIPALGIAGGPYYEVTPDHYTPPAPLPSALPSTDARLHFQQEAPTLIAAMAKGTVLVDEKTIAPVIEAHLAELRKRFDTTTLEGILKGQFNSYLQALSGARFAIRRWAENSQVWNGSRVLELIDALATAESIKGSAFRVYSNPQPKETMQTFLQPSTQALREAMARALVVTTPENWRATVQPMLDRIETFADAQGVLLQ